ncbi:hypothetical protein [Lentzea flava]|uniref:Uncharacterized protein n=1 Tax=Lentzea flava TaxID=103732 RepID=A0ABQ2UCG8_9PSEU|nr:hypothetical protein [Lentzea flava]MCP2197732.1 hypothetical protein [Lentzea flava]GGU21788.1 hypothetical protein GCM10010178_12570 [Lentzea flava]
MTDNNQPGPGRPAPEPGQPGQPQQPPPYQPAPQPQPPVKKGKGSVRQQQAGVTKPRQPTVAEQRARAAALKAQQERFAAESAAFEKRRKTRKRLLIGGGVTLGVVALVAIWYAAASPKNVQAQCTDQNNVIVDDDYCSDSYYRSHGGYSSGGFIYIGSNSYRYNYGGTGVVGQKVTGGSYTIPKGANVTTKSGTTVQRGGFGISSGSSSSGG